MSSSDATNTTSGKSAMRHIAESVLLGGTIGYLTNCGYRRPIVRYPMAYPAAIAAVLLGKAVTWKMASTVPDDISEIYARLHEPIEIELAHDKRPRTNYGSSN